MTRRICECDVARPARGSILCATCQALVIDPDLAGTISNAVDAAAKAKNSVATAVPLSVLVEGGYRVLSQDVLLSRSELFATILPFDEIRAWLLRAAAPAAFWAVRAILEEIRRWRRSEEEIRGACLAVFGTYFGLSDLPSLSALAPRNSLAATFQTIFEQHTRAGALGAEVEAICDNDEDVFSELTDDHPCSVLLKATIQLVRSKVRAAFGNLDGAYRDLQAVWNCRRCTDELEARLGSAARLILLRQILNHTYLLSADHSGRLDWDAYRYSSWIQEASQRMGLADPGEDHPSSDLDFWKRYGDIGPGLGLHFMNVTFHRRIDARDTTEARKAVVARFGLARAWDEKTPSPTTWNQFSQIAGQALFIDESSLAKEVLGYASHRAGHAEYPPGGGTAMVLPNPAVKMDQYSLEWLLHLALRDQADGLIRPDMGEGEGKLADIRNRLIRSATSARFRRVSQAIYCRIFPEAIPEAKPDAFFPSLGYGTGVFLPRVPRSFSMG